MNASAVLEHAYAVLEHFYAVLEQGGVSDRNFIIKELNIWKKNQNFFRISF